VVVNVIDIDGSTPLLYAVKRLMSKVVKTLVDLKADLSAPRDSPKQSIVQIAVRSLNSAKHPKEGEVYAHGSGNVEAAMIKTVQILLEGKAEVSVAKKYQDCDVWHYAIHGNCEDRNIKLFEVLLKIRPGTVPTYRGGGTIMHEVAGLTPVECLHGEDIQMLELLAQQEFDPCIRDDRSMAPVDFADQRDKPATVRYLLSCFYDPLPDKYKDRLNPNVIEEERDERNDASFHYHD
jgi:hypothetical protein